MQHNQQTSQDDQLDFVPPVVVDDDHDDGHGELDGHVDEKWLVSYADLMTLLFGLFVMLYSMAMETQGNPNDVLKKVSEAVVADTKTPQAPPVVANAESQEGISENTQPVEPAQAREIASVDNVDELKKMVEELTSAKEEIQKKLDEALAKVAEFEEKLNLSEESVKKLTADLEKVKAELSEKNEQIAKLQELLKNKSNLNPKVLEEQQREIASLKEKLSKLSDLTKEEVEALKASMLAMTAELDQQKKLNLELTKKLEKLNTMAQNKFLMVATKWSTEKHDIDMSITDPQGRVYDYKKKKIKGSEGVFELDSRFGPGVEMWRTSQIEPGVYKISIVLYNQYGNTQDAIAQISILSNSGSQTLSDISLNNKEGKRFEYQFVVDTDGNIRKVEK